MGLARCWLGLATWVGLAWTSMGRGGHWGDALLRPATGLLRPATLLPAAVWLLRLLSRRSNCGSRRRAGARRCRGDRDGASEAANHCGRSHLGHARRRGVGHEPKPSSVAIGLIRRVPMSHLVTAAGSCAAAGSGSFSSLALPSGWRSQHAACPSSWLDRNCLSQWRPRQADDAAAGGAGGRRVAAGPPTRLRGGLKRMVV